MGLFLRLWVGCEDAESLGSVCQQQETCLGCCVCACCMLYGFFDGKPHVRLLGVHNVCISASAEGKMGISGYKQATSYKVTGSSFASSP